MWGGKLSRGQAIAFKITSFEIEIEVLSFFLPLIIPLIAFRLLYICVLSEFHLATESLLWHWSIKSFKRSKPLVLGVEGLDLSKSAHCNNFQHDTSSHFLGFRMTVKRLRCRSKRNGRNHVGKVVTRKILKQG